MPNIAQVLKGEIVRLARKELRAEIDGMKKAATLLRTEVVSLRKRVAVLEKRSAKEQPVRPSAEAPARIRFTSKGLAAQRQRLGLSATALGLLLGVSAQTVHNWETGKSNPQSRQLPLIAALRKMGKKQARARLEEK